MQQTQQLMSDLLLEVGVPLFLPLVVLGREELCIQPSSRRDEGGGNQMASATQRRAHGMGRQGMQSEHRGIGCAVEGGAGGETEELGSVVVAVVWWWWSNGVDGAPLTPRWVCE